MSKVMAMLTGGRDIIGFLMFAGEDAPFSGETWSGKCIFTGVPKKSDVYDDPLCEFLQNNKNTEFSAVVKGSAAGFSVSVPGLLEAKLDEQLKGTWSPEGNMKAGLCMVPNTKS